MKKISVLAVLLLAVFVIHPQQKAIDDNQQSTDSHKTADATDDVAVGSVESQEENKNKPVESRSELKSDKEKSFYISTLPQEDDPFAHYNPRRFWKTNNYQKSLIRNRRPFFFVEELDCRNLTLNTNVALRTPYTQVPFGGLSTVFNSSSHHAARGLDFGFYFRDEHLMDGRVMLSALNSFAFNGAFYTLAGVDVFPGSEDRKLKLLSNIAVYTTAPQYGCLSERNSPVAGVISSFTDKIGLDFAPVNKTGFHFMFGGEYKLPLNIYVLGAVKFNYHYIASTLTNAFGDEYPAETKDWKEDFLSLSFIARGTLDTRRQNKAMMTGNMLTGAFSLDLPFLDSNYYHHDKFIPQFSITGADTFCKKLYKDYAVKARVSGGYNYGYLTNLSGDVAVRGLSLGSFSGFAYAMANIEASIPVMYIDLYKTADYTHRQKVTYLMYLNLFVDGGLAFSNDSMQVRDYEYLEKNNYLKDFRCYVDDDNYLTYALSAGGGITFVPYFLHFVVRIDVSVNILESILEQKAPSIGLTVSFNDMF